MPNKHIELEEYIDLHQLLELDDSTQEEYRQFGLAHEALLSTPTLLLKRWIEENRHMLPLPISSTIIITYLNRATAVLLLVAFLLGLFSGFGLLSYSGHEPVNILYFLSMVFLLPLVTMSMTLWAMIQANKSSNMLIHISPAYWMERIVALLPDKSRDLISKLQINPQISNWITIRRSQALALGFSLGLLLALLGVIATRDIAFGWSSTLRISPHELHDLFSFVALPWSAVLPEALPSLELIEKSHYFRLGGVLSADMVRSASQLGEWWKFLLMSTLFYALVLRFFLFVWTGVGLRRALDEGVFSIGGVQEIVHMMQTPLISTEAIEDEELLSQSSKKRNFTTVDTTTEQSFGSVIGWAIEREALMLHNDRIGLKGVTLYEAGGLHSLESDEEVIESISSDTLLYVKSWEPPTMDFMDFLMLLTEKDISITLYPLGTADNDYRATDRDYDIWRAKVDGVKLDNFRMKR